MRPGQGAAMPEKSIFHREGDKTMPQQIPGIPRVQRRADFRILALAAALGATGAHAQSSVTIYGSLDQYVNHMRSSSGASMTTLEDGALLRSRLGFRGQEDLGGGLYARFQLEMGINADNGTQADSTRGFDRQSWVGLGGGWGEVRLGRQNTVISGAATTSTSPRARWAPW
jgi:predicted porin